jgi:hypothetical protein
VGACSCTSVWRRCSRRAIGSCSCAGLHLCGAAGGMWHSLHCRCSGVLLYGGTAGNGAPRVCLQCACTHCASLTERGRQSLAPAATCILHCLSHYMVAFIDVVAGHCCHSCAWSKFSSWQCTSTQGATHTLRSGNALRCRTVLWCRMHHMVLSSCQVLDICAEICCAPTCLLKELAPSHCRRAIGHSHSPKYLVIIWWPMFGPSGCFYIFYLDICIM